MWLRARFRLFQLAHLLTFDPLWRTPYHNLRCGGCGAATQRRRRPDGQWGSYCRACCTFMAQGVRG